MLTQITPVNLQKLYSDLYQPRASAAHRPLLSHRLT